MNPSDLLVIVALNSSVAALLKSNGRILWQTDLPGIMGNRFVTITADDSHVYAYAKGKMHCLSLAKGKLLWTNELKGFGYGIASICVPGFSSAPDPAAYAKHQADQEARTSTDTSATTS